MCLKDKFLNLDHEFSSMLNSKEFRCMSECFVETKKDDLDVKPQMRQPIFVLKKKIVNCRNEASANLLSIYICIHFCRALYF